MNGAQNGLVGDNSYGVDIPETQVPDEKSLQEEKKIAKYSKSKEFSRIKEYFQTRIDFYQKYLPDGREIGASSPTPEDWRVANLLIKEFKALTDSYESINEIVEEHRKRTNG